MPPGLVVLASPLIEEPSVSPVGPGGPTVMLVPFAEVACAKSSWVVYNTCANWIERKRPFGESFS